MACNVYFSQRFVDGLGCLSYVIGDEATGEALVVDPQVDAAWYVAHAEAAGLDVTHVVDTHVHADHASGARALARLTGARVGVPSEARAAFEHEPLRDGDEIKLGESVHVRVRDAPGHTPEHVVLEVFDMTRDPARPYAVLTGDTLLVGNVGRPDLDSSMSADDLAQHLHHSVRDLLRRFPDGTLVYPGHGAGSACGAHLGHVLASSIGQAKDAIPHLEYKERQRFVEHVLHDLPPKPGNARGLKALNREGPPAVLPRAHEVPALPPEKFRDFAEDALVVDTRAPDAFAANHVPGSINVSADSSKFANWVARFLEWRRPVLLVLPDADALTPTLLALARVGGTNPHGWLKGGLEAWRTEGHAFGTVRVVNALEARDELASGYARLLDVRSASEWENGHVDGATWIPWEELAARTDELDKDTAWIVTCASGYRSSIAASVLKREGFPRVANLLGGMTAWHAAETRDATAPAHVRDRERERAHHAM